MSKMTKTHLKSLTHDPKVSENLTKWPKITSKRKWNAKNAHQWQKKAEKRPGQCLKIAICDRLFDATLRPTSKSGGARSLRSPARFAREGLPWISRWASVTYYFSYGIPYAL